MLSDLTSLAKYPEVKGQQKIEKDGELYKQKGNAINQLPRRPPEEVK